MSKQRFLGGLLGANPFRDGSFTDTLNLDTYDFSNATVQLSSNGGASAYVGYNSVSISKDGNTAVASSQFGSSSTGQVLVFEKSGGTWSQVADLDCPESATEVSFGHDTDISDDGTVIIVSDNANKKNSSTTTGIQQGNVYVYEKGAGWSNGTSSHTKTFLVTDNNENSVNYLGDAITISGDGNTIAAGNRLGTSNRAYASSKLGSVYLWEKNGTWAATSSTPTILISTSQATNGYFGCDEKHAISLSEDGQTLAIRHRSRTTAGRLEIHEAGAGGWTAPSNSSATSAHHVSILDGTGSGNGHGNRVAISNDGLTIASEVVGNDTIIIHEKGAGWPSVGMTSQVATLSNSAATSMDFNGMSKDGNYVTAYDAGSYELLIWVKPATGWVDATETYRIAADATSTSTFGFGQWAAISDVGDLIISDNRHASNAGRVEFHSGTTSVEIDRTTSNVGILSLDEAGPEDLSITSTGPATLNLANTTGTETVPYEVDGLTSQNDGAYFSSTGVTSGKHYWEIDYDAWGPSTPFYSLLAGVYRDTTTPTAGGSWVSSGQPYYGWYGQNQNYTNSVANGALQTAANSAPFPSLSGGTIGILLDADNHTITVYIEGTVSADVNGMSTGGSGTETYYATFASGGGYAWTHEVNFGQRPFVYSVPAGATAGFLNSTLETREIPPLNWGGIRGRDSIVEVSSSSLSYGTWGATDSAFTLTADPYHINALHPGGWQARKFDATMTSGKYYAEIYVDPGHSNMYIGLATSSFADGAGWVGDSTDGMGLYAMGGAIYHSGSGQDPVTGSSYNSGSNVVQVAVDLDSRKAWWGVNNTWHSASADPSTGTSGIALRGDLTTADLQFAISSINNTSSFHFNDGNNGTFDGKLTAGGNTDANGNGDFYYAVPTGFQGAYSSSEGTLIKLAPTGILSLNEALMSTYGAAVVAAPLTPSWWEFSATDAGTHWQKDSAYQASRTSAGWSTQFLDTRFSTGKYYAEFRAQSTINTFFVGVGTTSAVGSYLGQNSTTGWGAYANALQHYPDQGSWTPGFAYDASDVFGIAVDADTGTVWTHVNGTWMTQCGDPSSGGSGWSFNSDMTDFSSSGNPITFGYSTSSSVFITNFNGGDNPTFGGVETAGGYADGNGYGDFKYAVPTGFQGCYTLA